MALYPGLTLTEAGIQMIAESQLNETKLIITKAKIGDGDLPVGHDISKMTDVLSAKLEAPFSSFKNLGNGQIDIKFAVSNAELEAGFFAKEIGIFASLEDGTETLYAYTNAGNKTDWIADKSTPIDSQVIECQLVIGNAPNVVVNITDKAYALAEDLAKSHKDLFDNKADKLENGHGIVRSVNNQYADDSGNVNVSGIDIGMVIPFAGNGDIPAGFLLCNGASVLRETYPDLFGVIGTTYGSEDDLHFNLPDLSDRFIEGSDVAGDVKEAGLPNITGLASGSGVAVLFDGSSGALRASFLPTAHPLENRSDNISTNVNAGNDINFDASWSNSIYGASSTVQPPALTMRYIIKAFGCVNNTGDVEITQTANELNEFKSSVKDYVVESYNDGNGNWYRKFKSGWVEQGGVLPVLSKVESKVVALLKPFATNKYTVLIQHYHDGDTINIKSYFADGLSISRFSVFNFTTTSFNVYYGYNKNDGLEQKIWYACGQGVEE